MAVVARPHALIPIGVPLDRQGAGADAGRRDLLVLRHRRVRLAPRRHPGAGRGIPRPASVSGEMGALIAGATIASRSLFDPRGRHQGRRGQGLLRHAVLRRPRYGHPGAERRRRCWCWPVRHRCSWPSPLVSLVVFFPLLLLHRPRPRNADRRRRPLAQISEFCLVIAYLGTDLGTSSTAPVEHHHLRLRADGDRHPVALPRPPTGSMAWWRRRCARSASRIRRPSSAAARRRHTPAVASSASTASPRRCSTSIARQRRRARSRRRWSSTSTSPSTTAIRATGAHVKYGDISPTPRRCIMPASTGRRCRLTVPDDLLQAAPTTSS